MHINIKFMGYLYKIVFLAKTHAYYSEKYFKMKSKKKFNLRERPREHRYSQSRVVVVEFCIGNGLTVTLILPHPWHQFTTRATDVQPRGLHFTLIFEYR